MTPPQSSLDMLIPILTTEYRHQGKRSLKITPQSQRDQEQTKASFSMFLIIFATCFTCQNGKYVSNISQVWYTYCSGTEIGWEVHGHYNNYFFQGNQFNSHEWSHLISCYNTNTYLHVDGRWWGKRNSSTAWYSLDTLLHSQNIHWKNYVVINDKNIGLMFFTRPKMVTRKSRKSVAESLLQESQLLSSKL